MAVDTYSVWGMKNTTGIARDDQERKAIVADWDRKNNIHNEDDGDDNDDVEDNDMDDELDKEMSSLLHSVSYTHLLSTSSYSLFMTVSEPLAIMSQVVVMSRFSPHGSGTVTLASFAAATAPVNAIISLLNYFSDGLTSAFSSETSKADSAPHHWYEVGVKLRIALLGAVVIGTGVAAILLILLSPDPTQKSSGWWNILRLLHCPSEALTEAQQYGRVRAFAAPIQLLSIASIGCAMGCGLSFYAALSSVVGALIDGVGGVLLFTVNRSDTHIKRLFWLGFVNLTSYTITSIIALVSVFIWLPKLSTKSFFFGKSALLQLHKKKKKTKDDASVLVKDAHEVRAHGKDQVQPQSMTAPLLLEDTDVSSHYNDNDDDIRGVGGESTNDHEASVYAFLSNFVSDGLSMTIRSTCLQLTFVIATTIASSKGVNTLAAHQIILQLWIITSYTVDALAITGNTTGAKVEAKLVVPSSLHATSDLKNRDLEGEIDEELSHVDKKKNHYIYKVLNILVFRLLILGSCIGVFAMIMMATFKIQIQRFFTHQPKTLSNVSSVWYLLCIAQPVNSLVFVYDGFLLASKSYSFMRNMMTTGLILIFLPCILMSTLVLFKDKTLFAIWLSKAVLNLFRLLSAIWRIHGQWLREKSKLA